MIRGSSRPRLAIPTSFLNLDRIRANLVPAAHDRVVLRIPAQNSSTSLSGIAARRSNRASDAGRGRISVMIVRSWIFERRRAIDRPRGLGR
jgi:hypothetical protein